MARPFVSGPARPVVLALMLLLGAGSGCHHRTTVIPGVLDMRTDASGVPTNNAPLPASREVRTGSEAIMLGSGVQGTSTVTIEDRTYWIVSLLPVGNTSATEEFATAMGKGGGLRDVKIGEVYGLLDWAIWAGVVIIPRANIFSLAMPPRDFLASGTRIALPSAPATPPTPTPTPDASPPPAPDAPPPPSPAPAASDAPAPAPATPVTPAGGCR